MIDHRHLPSYKAILVGETAVGKTSIIMRFKHDLFLPEFQPTVGASFITKPVETTNGMVNLEIWDTAGQERYRSLVPMYCRGADLAIVVFDLSTIATFVSLDSWVKEIKQMAPPSCVIIVVGNKADLPSAVSSDDVQTWVERQTVSYHTVSALNGQGVGELLTEILDSLSELREARVQYEDVKNRESRGGCC